MEKLVVLFPTQSEAAGFHAEDRRIEVRCCGVGVYRCAVATMQIIASCRPCGVVLAGIAGAYPESGLHVGDTVIVSAERAADMGRFTGDGFEGLFGERLVAPSVDGVGLTAVESITVNGAGAPYIDRRGAQIENMEGTAFFHACTVARVPFWEVRAISNRVGDTRVEWCVPEAVAALGRRLNEVCRILLNR